MSGLAQPNNFPTFYPAIFDSGTGTSMAGNLTSNWIPVMLGHGYSIEAIWTGTPNGQFYVETSNNPGSIGDEIPGSAVVVSGAAGQNMWNIENPRYRYARLVWIASSSTGALGANCFVPVARDSR